MTSLTKKTEKTVRAKASAKHAKDVKTADVHEVPLGNNETKGTDTKSRYWVFTSFQTAHPPVFNEELMNYLCYGLEICPTTKKEHYQSYVEFHIQKRTKYVSHLFGKVWCRPRALKANSEQSSAYCKKDGHYTEHGVRNVSKQGERTDIKYMHERIIAGDGLATIMKEHTAYLQWGGRVKEMITELSTPDYQEIKEIICEIHWGVPGAGKTWNAIKNHNDGVYEFEYNNGVNWFCGYNNEPVLLFDEFECQIPITTMNKYLDVYRRRLQVKGGHTYANWRKVIICSNDDPKTWYHDAAPIKREAFFRRVHLTKHYPKKYQISKKTTE